MGRARHQVPRVDNPTRVETALARLGSKCYCMTKTEWLEKGEAIGAFCLLVSAD